MENVEITRPVGLIDDLARRQARGLSSSQETTGDSSTDELAHGDVVVGALTRPLRFLIAGVLLANLALGACLVARSDFSNVKPQGEARAGEMPDRPSERPSERPSDQPRSEPAPIHGTQRAPAFGMTLATVNDRD